MNLHEDVNLQQIAEKCLHFTGADFKGTYIVIDVSKLLKLKADFHGEQPMNSLCVSFETECNEQT